MLKRIDWQALQEAQKVASKPMQLEFSFAEVVPHYSSKRKHNVAHKVDGKHTKQ
jgi:hypothetical protein